MVACNEQMCTYPQVMEAVLEAHAAAVLPEGPRLLAAVLALCANPCAEAGLVEALLEALRPLLQQGDAANVFEEVRAHLQRPITNMLQFSRAT
eukprot:3490527-Pyramimonas_sp.AAC.1